jgi:transketolase
MPPKAKAIDDRPSLIVARTHIGYGSPHKHDTFEAYGEPLGVEEVRLTKRVLGWPEDRLFYIPDEALAQFRKAVEQGHELETQ